jgi:hypothetical protein
MKTQRFGIEIEMTGLTRKEAAKVLATHFGVAADYDGGGYDAYAVTDSQGRKWKLVSDGSIRAQLKNGSTATDAHKVELVSPICTYADIETVQALARALRGKGAVVNDSCGIHVHVDAAAHTARSLKNLTNIMASKENLLFKALAVKEDREHYCKKVDRTFLERLNKARAADKNRIKTIWYDGGDRSSRHYDNSRYHALNLHSVWQKGTVEFRCFNSTLHAGEIKTYIQLSLAINHQALTQASASYRTTETTNDKYTFRTWLLRMGLIGDEFGTARHHLLKNLAGNIAWRDGRAA